MEGRGKVSFDGVMIGMILDCGLDGLGRLGEIVFFPAIGFVFLGLVVPVVSSHVVRRKLGVLMRLFLMHRRCE